VTVAPQAPETATEGAPRVGPPLSTYSLIDAVLDAADALEISLYPWQRYSLDVAMSVDADERFTYREVAWIAARQNGKTEVLLPRIKWALDNGRRVIHTAQNRLLPRKVFQRVARIYPDAKVRYANGQEEITTKHGGSYMIVAPQRGARGETADDLIIDELREMEDFDFIAAAEPTLTASDNPQVLYLSNAGTELSVVLNDLRKRADSDPTLAYMEWSADPERAVDDREGWLEANPSIGYGNLTLKRLETLYNKYREAGALPVFETEHLCRQVQSMFPRLVLSSVWMGARRTLEVPLRASLGISVDPAGKRASAVLAWPQSDGTIGMMVSADVTGDPVDTTRLAADLEPIARAAGVHENVAYDPWTDKHLARHFTGAKPIQGQDFANASERFVRALETGQLRWSDADALSNDLPYAARKPTQGTAWTADRSNPERPITAVLAAIRAVWLASNPQVQKPQVY
jgi:hypothetical protein